MDATRDPGVIGVLDESVVAHLRNGLGARWLSMTGDAGSSRRGCWCGRWFYAEVG
jgi:hypothetical protein